MPKKHSGRCACGRRIAARNAGNFKSALPHHHKVYEAVRRGQPEAARKAMLDMVAESRANIRGRGKGKGKT